MALKPYQKSAGASAPGSATGRIIPPGAMNPGFLRIFLNPALYCAEVAATGHHPVPQPLPDGPDTRQAASSATPDWG